MPPRVLAESMIRSDVATVRRLAQTPSEHVAWDLRFTQIDPLGPPAPGRPQRFRYATRLGFGLAIEGWGETIESPAADGSALRFGSDDARSLIEEGTGSWTYVQEGDRVRFRTVYDYRARHGALGRLVDRAAFRPLMTWATRWSFDRLRIRIERGIAPNVQMRLWIVKRVLLALVGLVWILSGLVPKVFAVRASELALVARSGLWWVSPEATLATLGIVEALVGAWVVTGIAERASIALTAVGALALGALVAALDPLALTDPYSGVVKNLGLLGCAIAILALSPITPKASRARPRRRA